MPPLPADYDPPGRVNGSDDGALVSAMTRESRWLHNELLNFNLKQLERDPLCAAQMQPFFVKYLFRNMLAAWGFKNSLKMSYY